MKRGINKEDRGEAGSEVGGEPSGQVKEMKQRYATRALERWPHMPKMLNGEGKLDTPSS